jgi:hypothetical protein
VIAHDQEAILEGFRIGIGKYLWVVTFEPRRRVYLPVRTTLTMTEYVNAEGSAISPMVIIEGAVLLERYFTDLPD